MESDQLPLDFEPHKLHRRRGPDTSRAAALAAGELRETHHRLILNMLTYYGSLTSEQIAERSGIEYHAVARRMGELRDAGLVEDLGRTANRSGRMATVWGRRR